MGGHPQPGDFFVLQTDIGIDQVIGEHAALEQKFTVGIQRAQRLVEIETDLGNLLLFFRGKIVKILSIGPPGMNLVLDAIQTGHHHGGEGQIRIGGRVRETHFDAATLRTADVGDADRSGAVAR